MAFDLVLQLESLWRAFEAVPAAVYAAMTASSITLIGLWLQNRGESQRNLQRLEHDAWQRDREREMTLRREVYLRAAESLAQAQEYLAGLSRMDDSSQQHEALIKGVGADLNKVHIVGSMATVQAVVEANQFFAHALSDLSVHQLPIAAIEREIVGEQAAVDSAIARRDEALAQLKEMTRTAKEDARAWDLHQRIFNDEQTDIDAALARKERLQRQLGKRRLEFHKRCAEAGLELGQRVVSANLAIRRELELDLDAGSYRELMQKAHDRIATVLEDFHARAKQTAAATDAPATTNTRDAHRRLRALKGFSAARAGAATDEAPLRRGKGLLQVWRG